MSTAVMKALVIDAPYRAEVREVPYPKPEAGEVTIRVQNSGICGTDIHIFKGEFISPYPIIPGHEFSGIVHEIGKGVQGLQIGDRVTADPSLFCGYCEYCLTHRGNQCANWNALGNTVNGSMAEFVKVPFSNVVKLPDSMSFAEAAFVEPVACVVHAMNRLQIRAGDKAILFGAGAMGQQLIQTVIKSGVSELTVVDTSPAKLEMAKEFGATAGVLSSEIGKIDDRRGSFDIVIDATGIPAVIEQALTFMGKTAKYLQFGVTAKDAQIRLNPFELYNRDWTILGSMAINFTFLPAFQWVQAKRIQVEPLITRRIGLEDLAAFLEGARTPDDLKVQVSIGADAD